MTETTQKELFSLFKYSAGVLVAIVISMGGFWLSYGKELVTRAEARIITEDGIRALEKDVSYLNTQITKLDERMINQEERLQTTLKENTVAIIDLKVELAGLSQTLSILTNKIND